MLLEPRSQIYLYRSAFNTRFADVHITGPLSGSTYLTTRPSKPRAPHNSRLTQKAVHFLMCPSTKVISHRQLASARTSRDSCNGQGHDKRDTLCIKTYLANLNEFGDFRCSTTAVANRKRAKIRPRPSIYLS